MSINPNKITGFEDETIIFHKNLEKNANEFGHSFENLPDQHQEKIIEQTIEEHKNFSKESMSSGYKSKLEDAEKIVLNLSPDEDDVRMETLLTLMQDVGIFNTLKAIENEETFHIKDDFHRFLVQFIKAGNLVNLKKKSLLYPGLHMVLLEITLPEISLEKKSKGEKKEPLEVLLASMEQFYSGMIAVTENSDNKYFSIEIASPQGKKKVSFFCAVPEKQKGVFVNQLLAIFPSASVKESYNDYNIFDKKDNVAISSLKTASYQFLPIKIYKELGYDPLNIILKSFSNLDVNDGAAIQIVLSPGDEKKTNGKIVDVIDKISGGKDYKDIFKPPTTWDKIKKNIFKVLEEIMVIINIIFSSKDDEKKDDKKPKDQEKRGFLVEKLKAKNTTRLFQTNIRLVTSSDNAEKAQTILSELESAFYQYENPNSNKFLFDRFLGDELNKKIKEFIFRVFDKDSKLFLNFSELTSIFHFPEQHLNAGDILETASSSSGVSAEVLSNAVIGDKKEKDLLVGKASFGINKNQNNKKVDTKVSVIPQPVQKKDESIIKTENKEVLDNKIEKIVKKKEEKVIHKDASVLLGVNSYQGKDTPIYLQTEDRLRHMYVIGQTGTGKTTLMKNMVIQDIRNGDGCCFIDPHGSDIEDVISQVPPERFKDVIYFDPSALKRPFGLNMLEYDVNYPEQKTMVVHELLSIFKKLYKDVPESIGPAFEQYFTNSTKLVLEDPSSGNTMVEISRVLADEEFRNMKLSKCNDMLVKQFWEKIATKAGGEAALENIVPYITNKFDTFLSNDFLRPIIGQEKSSFNFRDVMDNKKILLVNLSKGKLGELNADMIGMILVSKILMAALSRVDSLDKNLPNFYLYIDEFQNITTDSISTILSEARKYKLSLNIAHQYIKQIDEKIRDSIFGNVGSLAIFRVGPEDAEIVEKQLSPIFNAKDIINLDNHNAYLKILVNGQPQKPFNVKTLPPEESNKKVRDYLKELSYQTYGRPRAEIEGEIQEKFARLVDLGNDPKSGKDDDFDFEEMMKQFNDKD